MDKWINLELLHKASRLLLLVFLAFSITGKVTSLYHEVAYRIQADAFIITLLIGTLTLQATGAVGIFQSFNQWVKRIAFGVLYLIGGIELVLYALSAVWIQRPEICDTIAGDEPASMLLGQVCFLLLLGVFHALNRQP
jgi:hypothetical protein